MDSTDEVRSFDSWKLIYSILGKHILGDREYEDITAIFWKLPMEKLTIQIAIYSFFYTIKPGGLRNRNRNRYITGLPEPVSLVQEPP